MRASRGRDRIPPPHVPGGSLTAWLRSATFHRTPCRCSPKPPDIPASSLYVGMGMKIVVFGLSISSSWPGKLHYERFNWGITRPHWRTLAMEAAVELGLH
jgi:hypothetical protein